MFTLQYESSSPYRPPARTIALHYKRRRYSKELHCYLLFARICSLFARILTNSVFRSLRVQHVRQGGHGFFCAIDIDKAVPKHSSYYPPSALRVRRKPSTPDIEDDEDAPNVQSIIKKRKRGDCDNAKNSQNYTICMRYDSMLHLEFLRENELVVVEQPWLAVVNSLPDPLERRVYGT